MSAVPTLSLVVLAALAAPAAAEPQPTDHRVARLVALGGATVAFIATETVFADALAPDACRWCSANRVDRAVRDALVWDDPAAAARTSDLTGHVAGPVIALGLLAITGAGDPAPARRLLDDAMPVVEAAIYGQLATNAVKFAVGRQRPYARFADAPLAPSSEDNLSWFSGHSSFAFSVAVSAGLVAHRRRIRWAPAVWGAGLALAAATAYLRIAADRHYLSDVVAGSAFGVAVGYAVPRLTGSLPRRMSLLATPTTLGIAGAF